MLGNDADWRSLAAEQPGFVADIWRIRYVARTGGIAVEPDIYCTGPLTSRAGFVIGREKDSLVSSAILGLPAHSVTLARLKESADIAVASGDLPPNERQSLVDQSSLTYHLTRSGELEYAQPVEAFYSVPLRRRLGLVTADPEVAISPADGASAVRLWSRRLKRQLVAMTEAVPEPGSFLDGCLKSESVDPSAWPIALMQKQIVTRTSLEHVAYLLDAIGFERPTQVVDVGANPLSDPPYKRLFDMGGCNVLGFEPHPEAFAALQKQAAAGESYLPHAVGDGQRHTLRISRDSGLTSVFPAYEGAFNFLGRSRKNMETVDQAELDTVRLDDLDEVPPFDLLKIDIQGGEVLVFEGAATKLRHATAVITEIRYYQLYEGEPMFGGIDVALRKLGFQLHKIVEEKAKVIPNSQIDRLKRSVNRNQVIDADAVYVRDLGEAEALSNAQLAHLAILAAGVFDSYDLALFCLDALVERGVIAADIPAGFAARLPASHLR